MFQRLFLLIQLLKGLYIDYGGFRELGPIFLFVQIMGGEIEGEFLGHRGTMGVIGGAEDIVAAELGVVETALILGLHSEGDGSLPVLRLLDS